MASSSKGSKQDKTKASTKAHGRVTLEADLRDETLPDSAWYERFKTDFCFGDSNHELLKVWVANSPLFLSLVLHQEPNKILTFVLLFLLFLRGCCRE